MRRGKRKDEEGAGGRRRGGAHTNLISCILCGLFE